MGHPELETPRLRLRVLTPEDAEAAFRWCGDPLVNRYMIYPLHESVESVRAWLRTLDPCDPDAYTYGIVWKPTGELAGSTGMYYRPETGVWSFGYNLCADMWGRGIATEATQALIEYVRRVRPVRVVEAEHAVDNPASGRVMEKLGLRFVRCGAYAKAGGGEVFSSRVYRREFVDG